MDEIKFARLAPERHGGRESTPCPPIYLQVDHMKFEIGAAPRRTRNTGGSNTRSEASIDFLSFSLKANSVSRNHIMGVLAKQANWSPCQSMHGYALAQRVDHITMCWGGNNDTMYIEISGQGCRELEKIHNIKVQNGWTNLLEELQGTGAKFCRIDFAFDDFLGLISYSRILRKIKSKSVLGCFRKARKTEEIRLSDATITGTSLMFGGKESDYAVKVYDKNLETGTADGQWTRLEVTGRKSHAQLLVLAFIEGGYSPILSDLRQRLSFRVPSTSDTNKARWKECDWWLRFVRSVPKQALRPNAAMTTNESKVQTLVRQWGAFLGELQKTVEGQELLNFIIDESQQSFEARAERQERATPRRRVGPQAHMELRAKVFQDAHSLVRPLRLTR